MSKKNTTANPIVIPDTSVIPSEVEGSLQKEIDSLNDKLKRALADYQNLERNQHQARTIEKSRIIVRFLPLLDSIELVYKHTKDPVIEMTVKEFKKVLAELGVDTINGNPGIDFDSLTMECVEVVAGEKDRVIKTIQPGYKLGEIILRPAKVEVGGLVIPSDPSVIPSDPSVIPSEVEGSKS